MNQVVHVETPTRASREQVWALLSEVETWPRWSSFDDAALEREGDLHRQGVGAIRRFVHKRTRSREEVVAFDPPAHFAYRLLSGVPARDYRADVTLRDRDGGGTLITWHSTFRAKIPGTGSMVRRSLGRFIARLGADLAVEAERLAGGEVSRPR